MDIMALFGGFSLFLLACFLKLKSKGFTTKEILTALFAVAVMLTLILLAIAGITLFIPPL